MFYQGNEPLAVFFLCSGRARLTRGEPGGLRSTVRELAAPGFLGERALIAGETHDACAQLQDDAIACSIDADAFLGLWKERPAFARAMARQLAVTLGEIESAIAEFSQRTVLERLAGKLSERLARASATRPLPIGSRGELAEALGTAPEVVSRGLAQLRRRGILEVRARRAWVLDPEALRAAAGLPARDEPAARRQ